MVHLSTWQPWLGPAEQARMDGLCFLRSSWEYLCAARVVNVHYPPPRDTPPHAPKPAYYLATHAIETAFKAFLACRAVPIETLVSKYKHDLAQLKKEAVALGLENFYAISAEDSQTIHFLERLNKHQALRYHRTWGYQFPHWATVEPLADRLYHAAAEALSRSGNRGKS